MWRTFVDCAATCIASHVPRAPLSSSENHRVNDPVTINYTSLHCVGTIFSRDSLELFTRSDMFRNIFLLTIHNSSSKYVFFYKCTKTNSTLNNALHSFITKKVFLTLCILFMNFNIKSFKIVSLLFKYYKEIKNNN